MKTEKHLVLRTFTTPLGEVEQIVDVDVVLVGLKYVYFMTPPMSISRTQITKEQFKQWDSNMYDKYGDH